MLIHPWDAALDVAQWQDWLASTDRFGYCVQTLTLLRPRWSCPYHRRLMSRR